MSETTTWMTNGLGEGEHVSVDWGREAPIPSSKMLRTVMWCGGAARRSSEFPETTVLGGVSS
jgi:hypothetical protein